MISVLIKSRLKLLQQTTMARHNKLALLIRISKDEQTFFISPNDFGRLLKKQSNS